MRSASRSEHRCRCWRSRRRLRRTGHDVVALSFSTAFPARQIPALLQQLRAAVPPATQLWAGGAGCAKIAAPEGVLIVGSLDDAVAALGRWRSARG